MFLYEVALQYEDDVIQAWHIWAENAVEARAKGHQRVFADFVHVQKELHPNDPEPEWDDFMNWYWDDRKHSIHAVGVVAERVFI